MTSRDQAKQKVRKLENQDRTGENSEGRGQSQVRDGSQEVWPEAKELTVQKAVVQARMRKAVRTRQ